MYNVSSKEQEKDGKVHPSTTGENRFERSGAVSPSSLDWTQARSSTKNTLPYSSKMVVRSWRQDLLSEVKCHMDAEDSGLLLLWQQPEQVPALQPAPAASCRWPSTCRKCAIPDGVADG